MEKNEPVYPVPRPAAFSGMTAQAYAAIHLKTTHPTCQTG